ncbi:MAG: DUF1329 domain-containing protein [bacterium]
MKASPAFLTLVMLYVLLASGLGADEAKPEIIDKSNWNKAEGLVPKPFLEGLRKGGMIVTVKEPDYDTAEFFPDYALASMQDNVGKYALDDNDMIVDTQTGKLAKSIVGFPFPKVDPADPKAAIKVIYNKQYVTYILGFKRFTTITTWVGSETGFERDVEVFFHDAYLTGFPGAKAYPNPSDIERYSIISVQKPYDLAGTSIMLWRYLSDQADVNFSYVPAIRRVRRMTPANRSDGFVGSDFAVDDILAYDGKIPQFTWKLIGTQEALVPYVSCAPLRVEVSPQGEWVMAKDHPSIRYGYQDKTWGGSPWCPLNTIYSKRPVYVLEAKSKDPYYNYGTQYIWVSADTWGPAYKLVHDRSGEFWKWLSVTTSGFRSDDGKVKFLAWLDHMVVDPRREHASIISQLHPDTTLVYNAVLDLNDFSLSGFQKYCK